MKTKHYVALHQLKDFYNHDSIAKVFLLKGSSTEIYMKRPAFTKYSIANHITVVNWRDFSFTTVPQTLEM
jgi:hypothetical protein